jgi:hypothetical protein
MVEEAYKIALKPFHGWISSAAYRVWSIDILLFFFIPAKQLQIDLHGYIG